MAYQRYNSRREDFRARLATRYKPIFDDTFADLISKLDQIDFQPPKKS